MLQHRYGAQSCGEACFDDNSTSKGRACTGRGRFDINKGVWGGEVSSAGTPTGQARACSSLLHVQRCLCRLMVAKCPAAHKLLLHVRKRRLNLIRNPSQTNWSKVVGRSAFAPSDKMRVKMEQSADICSASAPHLKSALIF